MLDDLRFRLRTLFRRDAAEDDLDDELRFHLERAAEQHLARGLSPREAYRRARLEFGRMDVVKDDCRRSWGIRQLDALRQDVTFALRLIRKHPALSVVAAASLAIGIGVAVLMLEISIRFGTAGEAYAASSMYGLPMIALFRRAPRGRHSDVRHLVQSGSPFVAAFLPHAARTLRPEAPPLG